MQKQHIKESGQESKRLFWYLLALTGFFITLEISLFIQNSGLYLGDFRLIANHLTIPKSIIPGVLFFICMQGVIHLAYVYLIWGMTSLSAFCINRINKHIEKVGIGLWVLGIIVILLANQAYYPNSKFAILTSCCIPFLLQNICCFYQPYFFHWRV